LFYGHTHVREQHRTGKTLVANPGALFRANPKTCIVLDVVTGELKPVIVPVKSGDSNPGRAGLDASGNRSGLSPTAPTTRTPPPAAG
jgi:hypothetical protein